MGLQKIASIFRKCWISNTLSIASMLMHTIVFFMQKSSYKNNKYCLLLCLLLFWSTS